jgi:hypothetical protein
MEKEEVTLFTILLYTEGTVMKKSARWKRFWKFIHVNHKYVWSTSWEAGAGLWSKQIWLKELSALWERQPNDDTMRVWSWSWMERHRTQGTGEKIPEPFKWNLKNGD